MLIVHTAHIRRTLENDATLLRITDAFAREGSTIPSQVITGSESGSWVQLEADIASAAHELMAVLPAGHRTDHVAALLEQAKQRGVHVTIHDGNVQVQDASMSEEDDHITARVPQPLIVIDRRVIWDVCPSPNGLVSSIGAGRRIASPRAASVLVHAMVTSSHTRAFNIAPGA